MVVFNKLCRGESAVTLGQSIAQNNTLMILNLAYNNIGDTVSTCLSTVLQCFYALCVTSTLRHELFELSYDASATVLFLLSLL